MNKVSTQTMIFLTVFLMAGFGYYRYSEDAYFESNNIKNGYVILGFESLLFIPCNTNEEWWLVNKSVSVVSSGYAALAKVSYQPIYMSVVGQTSRKGSYGHMGASVRELEIYEVLTSSAGKVESCELQDFWKKYL